MLYITTSKMNYETGVSEVWTGDGSRKLTDDELAEIRACVAGASGGDMGELVAQTNEAAGRNDPGYAAYAQDVMEYQSDSTMASEAYRYRMLGDQPGFQGYFAEHPDELAAFEATHGFAGTSVQAPDLADYLVNPPPPPVVVDHGIWSVGPSTVADSSRTPTVEETIALAKSEGPQGSDEASSAGDKVVQDRLAAMDTKYRPTFASHRLLADAWAMVTRDVATVQSGDLPHDQKNARVVRLLDTFDAYASRILGGD